MVIKCILSDECDVYSFDYPTAVPESERKEVTNTVASYSSEPGGSVSPVGFG